MRYLPLLGWLLLGPLLPPRNCWSEPLSEKLIEVPVDHQTNPQALTRYLTGTAHTPRQKAERIYQWITHHISYDVAGLKSGQTSAQPEVVLQRRTGTCAGYSQLFQAMAQSAGLEVKILNGLARGSLDESLEAHGWNAIRLDGQWHLIDCTWGAGYVTGDTYYRSPCDFYFLAAPEQLITTHWPSQSSWQLLPSTVSRSEFEQMAPIKPKRSAGQPVTVDTLASKPPSTPEAGSPQVGPRALQAPRLLRSYYTRGATLQRPLEGTLRVTSQEFRVQLPGAKRVEVHTGSDAYSLIQGKQDLFRALVPLQPGKVRVLAGFDDSGRLEPLIEFEAR